MFNQLTATETVVAMGKAAEAAARGSGELGEFDRGQLLSAFSASRHLAVELTAYGRLLREYARAIGADERLDAATLGELTCTMLAEGRGDVAAIRAALRTLVDAEVDVLAAAIEDDPR